MLARSKGYLNGDLFAGYKLRSEFVARNYLTLDEIDRLVRSEPPSATLRLVRDAFLFSCFTGLSYVDLRGLTRRHIQHNRGHAWIDLTRRKTGTGVSVRLFALPLAILERYFPAAPDDRIFALPGNGWCNKCLERIVAAHKSIRTTQIYAVITHSTLDGEMNRLSARIDALYPNDTAAPCSGKAVSESETFLVPAE